MKRITVSILISLLGYTSAHCQNISTTSLNWTVDHLTDQKTLDGFVYGCTFQTNGKGNITWLQKGGAVSSTITVQAIDGSWPDISSNGQVTYSITVDGKSGSLKFEKNSGGTFISLDLSGADSKGLKHQYRVTGVSQ